MSLKKKFDFLFKEFIYGGHLQCLGASSIVFITAFFLKLDIKIDALIAAYFICYPLYLYNRWKEIEIDYTTNLERTTHFRKYIHIMPMLFWLVIAIIVSFLAYYGNLKSFIFGIILLVFGLLYTVVFKKVTRKLFLFKNFYVALSFTLLVLFTAIYYSLPLLKSSVAVPLIILMIFVFEKAFLMQIFLDLKDVESDRKEGLKTLGVLIGRDKTFSMLKILSILTTILVIAIAIFMPSFPKSILMLVFTVFFNFYSFKIAKNKNYFGYILGSGEFVLWPILILIGENLI